MATGDDDEANVGVGITSDDVVQLLGVEVNGSMPPGSQSRALIDQTRWSESYSASTRSRTSSMGYAPESTQPGTAPALRHKPSFDMAWQATVDERDEGLISEDDTDEGFHLMEAEFGEEGDIEEERTAAVVIAEEGRGLIVHGEGRPVAQLHVQPGRTFHSNVETVFDNFGRHYSYATWIIKHS